MFREIDLSLVRERNARMLREVQAERLGRRLARSRGARPGWRQTVRILLRRGFAIPSARPVRAGHEGVRPEDA